MVPILAALAAGVLFGAGLAIAQMVDPAKVIGFLDITGAWDPSLAFVLGGAVVTAALGFFAIRRFRTAPLFVSAFAAPVARNIDRPLVAGAVLFGVGWGLVGLCPGPALAGLAIAPGRVALFVAAMVAGMIAYEAWRRRRPAPPQRA